jgi:hypothetical protein
VKAIRFVESRGDNKTTTDFTDNTDKKRRNIGLSGHFPDCADMRVGSGVDHSKAFFIRAIRVIRGLHLF